MLSVLVAPSGHEHLIVSDRRARLALDVCVGSVLQGPVSLKFRLDAGDEASAQLVTLQRLIAVLLRPDCGIPPLRRLTGNRRIVAALRVADAIADGASHREIAAALVGAARVSAEWDASSDSMKSRVRRLVALAHRMTAGGWRTPLR